MEYPEDVRELTKADVAKAVFHNDINTLAKWLEELMDLYQDAEADADAYASRCISLARRIAAAQQALEVDHGI